MTYPEGKKITIISDKQKYVSTVGYSEMPEQLIIQPGATDFVSVVCLFMIPVKISSSGINVTFQVTNPVNYENLQNLYIVMRRERIIQPLNDL